jgi:2-iminobutanoate/2-iminopropanoate deaminase
MAKLRARRALLREAAGEGADFVAAADVDDRALEDRVYREAIDHGLDLAIVERAAIPREKIVDRCTIFEVTFAHSVSPWSSLSGSSRWPGVASTLNQAAIPPDRFMRQCRRRGAKPDEESRMVLKIERFQPEGMNIRMSGGKPSYSHVVTVSGSGKIVYTAGQLARDIDGNCVGKGDMRAQMEQTFRNLDLCLKAAGATWADVVKTNTFVTDFDEFQKCADIRMRYLGAATPTSTTVGVTRLAGPDFMIEIEAVAVVNS